MQALTDADRYPLITAEAYRFLQSLRQHPHAPAWNHRCGDRLTSEGLARVRDFERQLPAAPGWTPGTPPDWVYAHVNRCLSTVPYFRAIGIGTVTSADDFGRIPPTPRAALAREPWRFVPDDAPLDDLIVYDTSGRTGHPVVVPTHPIVVSMYLPLLRRALAMRGLQLDGGPDRVAIVNVCQQRSTFAFVSVSSYLDWSGFAKINLHAAEWRDPADRQRFLDGCNPEIYTGDPLSFAVLASLPLTARPKALVSTSMALPADVRRRVESRFACPVIDLYSLTESGPVAADAPQGSRLLRHDLYVEVLDRSGRPCAPGERGEIALTGGQNPFLPLVRYRTGDRAAMILVEGVPVLDGIEGRPATIFRDGAGGALNNVDIAAVLRPLRLPPFHLHQAAGGAIVFRTVGRDSEAPVRAALAALFGSEVPVEFGELPEGEPGSPVARYTSDQLFPVESFG